jgi:hypothetical protein
VPIIERAEEDCSPTNKEPYFFPNRLERIGCFLDAFFAGKDMLVSEIGPLRVLSGRNALT